MMIMIMILIARHATRKCMLSMTDMFTDLDVCWRALWSPVSAGGCAGHLDGCTMVTGSHTHHTLFDTSSKPEPQLSEHNNSTAITVVLDPPRPRTTRAVPVITASAGLLRLALAL